jgi:hypothetical protein
MEYYYTVTGFFSNNPIYAYFAYIVVVYLIVLTTKMGD